MGDSCCCSEPQRLIPGGCVGNRAGVNYAIACCCLKSLSAASLSRPDGQLWIKLRQKKNIKCVPSFLQSETRTSGCFVEMISQRSVKVKHKAEVKDKHNSCAVCLGRWAEAHIRNCCLAARNKCVRPSSIAVMCMWLFSPRLFDFFFFILEHCLWS